MDQPGVAFQHPSADEFHASGLTNPGHVVSVYIGAHGQFRFLFLRRNQTFDPIRSFHGVSTDCFLDVGVAGLHRLLDVLPELRTMSVLIACAGMEGALPTVLAGLVPQPVIAVPVSVGYGVSAGGRAALDGMLASCAPGLSVVNIDNGYGAAMAALRILKAATPQD